MFGNNCVRLLSSHPLSLSSRAKSRDLLHRHCHLEHSREICKCYCYKLEADLSTTPAAPLEMTTVKRLGSALDGNKVHTQNDKGHYPRPSYARIDALSASR